MNKFAIFSTICSVIALATAIAWFVFVAPEKQQDLTETQQKLEEIQEYLSKNHTSPPAVSYISPSTTDRINRAALRLLDACSEIRIQQNEIIAVYGLEMPEELESTWHSLNEEMKNCRDSVASIKADCDRKRNTGDYYEACTDPRLDSW